VFNVVNTTEFVHYILVCKVYYYYLRLLFHLTNVFALQIIAI